MNKLFTWIGFAAMLVSIAACRMESTQPSSGPELKPPADTEETAPAETAPAEPGKQGATIGAPGPAWANLEGTDGKMHSLSDIADAKVIAVVFTCNHCPVAQAYEDRLKKFATDYKDKGVELVAINVNNIEDDKLPAMKQRATDKEFTFAYLYDPSQKIGREYGAKVTPHAFVLDKSRNVAYIGAIDDNDDESAVEKHGMRDAVDALLAGKTPEVPSLEPHGCSIRYD